MKASPAIEEEEPKEEIHASLTVSIQLLEGAITAVTLKSLEKDYTGRPAYSALPVLLLLHSKNLSKAAPQDMGYSEDCLFCLLR